MELFSSEIIKAYKPYFEKIKVIDEANKIFDAVKSADQLDNEEKIASAVLSYLKLKEHYEKE